jgi:FkbM family methyltransferase
VSFVWLFWKYSQTFLPYYLWDLPSRVQEQASGVREAFALFAGRRSRMEFLRHLELRLTGDFDRLEPPCDDPQYFPKSLFRRREDECFVDCGAFDGDSLLSLADWSGGKFRKAVAFEADPTNFAALERTVAMDHRLDGRVRKIQAAVGRHRSKLRFAASGNGSAAISISGGIEVDCVPLDDILASERPTYIKMDIEGAEIDALQGAAVTLQSQPLVAACTYHTQDHLWQVPLQMRQLMPATQMVLRPHRADGFDLVCYSIPPDRAGIVAEGDDVSAEELCHSSA